MYLKQFILSVLISLFLPFCHNSLPLKQKKNKQVDIKQNGIIVFSKLDIDYFFPVKNTENVIFQDYSELQYKDGFVLPKIAFEKRNELIKKSDTLLFGYPATNVIPVLIEYKMVDSTNFLIDSFCLKLNGNISCLQVDTKFRLVKYITPLVQR